jgi:autotransporter-associated beta strand protein
VKSTALLLHLVVITLLCAASPAWGAGASGSFNISNASTTSQTLNAGSQTGTVTSSGTLNVNGSTVAVTVSASSGTVTIFNAGTIEQTATGRAIRNTGGGDTLTITNTAGGLITAAGNDAFQMKASGTLTIYNYGTISTTHADEGANSTGTGNQALNMNILNADGTTTPYTNTVYNYSGGTISSYEADGLRPGAGGIIYNSGTIKSTNASDNTSSSDGIDAQVNNSGVTIINGASQTGGSPGLIEGARHGITGGQNVDSAATPGTTGTFGASNNGVYDLPFTMSITNNAGSTIKGDNGSGVNLDGVDGTEKITITNSGTITGNGMTRDGDGVDIDGVVYISNTGTIQSLNAANPTYNTTVNGTTDLSKETSEGVTVGGGTIINSGTIEGSATTDARGYVSGVGRGITLAGIDHTETNGVDTDVAIQKIYSNPFAVDGTQTNSTGASIIINSGLIKGDSDAGIAIAGSATTGTSYAVTITNTLGGTIEGNSATVAAIDGSVAVGGSVSPIASTNNETIINYGTIKEDGSAKAISLGSGNNVVQIEGPSASVIGDMSGATLTGTNTAALTIDPTLGGTFSYGGVISNFTSVDIKSGNVIFSGANTYNGMTSIEGVLTLSGSGTIGTTTTLTISSTGTFNLGGDTVTVVNLNNSGSINNGSVTTTGTGTISGLSGNSSFTKNSAGTTILSGTNTYTGGTTISQGKLAVEGSVTGTVTVQSGAEVGGHGSIGGTIKGSGSVGPGDSPGILTASSTDPSGGLSYNFEFSQAGAATWSNAAASGNDVLHLTAALPFTSSLTSANTINLYFSSLSLTYEGGFFVNGSTDDLSSNIANATYNYYLLDNTSGTVTYNGNKYDVLLANHVLAGTAQITGANFGDGTTNGFTQSFYVSAAAIPEPSTYLLVAIGLAAILLTARRRGLGRKF